jgi:hypothetical protein
MVGGDKHKAALGDLCESKWQGNRGEYIDGSIVPYSFR